jgi:excisionase family DNA binding protein
MRKVQYIANYTKLYKKNLDTTKHGYLNKSITKRIKMRERVNSRLMSVDELANYLGLRKQTIYNWLHQKKITGIKIGKVWRFERNEIERWIKGHKKL